MLDKLFSKPPIGAYCELQELINLRYSAQKLHLAQRNRALSLLTGPNNTNFRGRGIDFEEVRGYQPGDDIRTIDWRVTARTGAAHTKVFREERERPVLVVTDQRDGMFFGSKHSCKSVLAGHYSALLCWAALNQGDRIGGLVFSGRRHREVRPRRSRRSVLAYLHELVEFNRALPYQDDGPQWQFSDMLSDLRRIAKPGSAIFIVSDFQGALDGRAMEHLYQLSRHSEIAALFCTDPLEAQLPRGGSYTVTDGQQRSRLHTGDNSLRSAFSARFNNAVQQLRTDYGQLGIPLIEASTAESPLKRLHTYYGDPRGNAVAS
jgi:uncharacterized protein (DUF58 family)